VITCHSNRDKISPFNNGTRVYPVFAVEMYVRVD
jgi:hypothetical protein